MSFHQPSVWLLLLLAFVPLLWRRLAGSRRPAIAFSSIGAAERVRPSWAARLRWIVPGLRTACLVVLIVSVARPRKADEHTRVFSEGVAIQLVVDRSGSMLATDFELAGRKTDRLTVVKKVVEDFVAGSGGLPGRPDDLIGLITFGTFADSLCPLTLDHDHLIAAVRQTQISPSNEDRATAIGDAIALGAERMAGLEERADLGADRIKSRVMILLTDGESNAGDIDPITAAKMAAAFDIRIYTIGAGTAAGVVNVTDPYTGRPLTVSVTIDEETLRQIAELTGGQYFRATDSRALEEVYARIDELERTRIEQQRYTDYNQLAVEPVSVAGVGLPPLLAVVIVLLGLEIILANSRFRTLP